jgi:hypothetical protein
MHKNSIGIWIFIGAIAVLSMNALTVSGIFLDPFVMAKTENNPDNSSSSTSISENSTITSSSNQSVTFYRFVDNLCNLTNTNSEGEVDRKGFLTYLNSYYGIATDYPSNWTYKESNSSRQDDNPFAIVSFSPPLSSDPNAETNLQIWVERLEDPTISLDEYAKNVIKSYRENNSNFSLVKGTSTNSTISNGFPAYTVIFTDYSNNLHRKSLEIGTISNVSKSAYYITFNTDESLYDKFSPLLSRIIKSFGIYDYHSLSDEQRHDGTYVQGYREGLDRMIGALCHPPVGTTETAGVK